MARAEVSKPEQLEREAFVALVQSAIKKTQLKQPLEPRERNAWKRWELEEDERRGRRYVSAVPKKTYCVWAGRQTKILHDQADLYGVPLRGATIDVPAVVGWLHDFLATHKHDLAPLVKAGSSAGRGPTRKEQLLDEQIALYRKKNMLLEEQLAEVKRNLLPRDEVHALLAQLAKILRAAGERLHKQFGDSAGSILEVALVDFESVVAQLEPAKGGDSAAESPHAAA